MNIEEKKTLDMLTTESVSILTQKFIEEDGEMLQVGKNHRRAYANSQSGREDLEENEPKDVVAAVFAIWGETPTITDESFSTQ